MSPTKESIKTQYPLSEVLSCIQGKSLNEHLVFPDHDSMSMSFNECSEYFDLEITRYNTKDTMPLYSILRIEEGGYIYLFWSDTGFQSDGIIKLKFYFYSGFQYEQTDYVSQRTLSEVIKENPFTQFVPYMSSGIFSYSYYNKDEVLQIEYDYPSLDQEPSVYNVKSITIINRKRTISCFSQLIDQDLP